jgi:hypothetical protein
MKRIIALAAITVVGVFAACGLGTESSSEEGLSTLQSEVNACTQPQKVLICHVPELEDGGVGVPFTICVAAKAEAAHLAHGDTAGACAVTPPADAGTPVDAGLN